MVWAVGQKLGDRYTIREVLGRGRSITYRAEDRLGQSVVIKAANDEAIASSDFARLQQVFVREAFKLAKCRHPHIVKAEEPFQFDGIWCIPMEYIAGTTLARRDRQVLPEAEAMKYVRQIGEALKVVHDHQLLHRDVTPANIMLRIRNGESEAVLIDFGLARDFNHDLTQTRTEETTPGFTPLELYSRDAERGAFTDIYSLGATLYELLTGKMPSNAQARKLSNAPLVFPDSMSKPIRQAIKWAMELDGKDRPQSVQEWLDTLGGAIASPVSPAPNPSVLSPPQPRWETWQVVIAGIAAIGGLLGGIAAMMTVLKPSPVPSPSPTQTTPSPTQTRQP
jgi:eukaryotic-like serine/threonine-protein kinase